MQNDEIKNSPDNGALGNEVQSAPDNKTPGDDGDAPAAAFYNNNNINVPSGHSDQWYKRNPTLLSKEVVFMRKRHPQAKYGFYPNSGDMFWLIELKVGKCLQPWTVLLRYDKDHPNSKFGGIKVIPVKPTFEEIRQQALDAGRKCVPHILKVNNGNEEYTCLITRRHSDVYSGKELVSSAVMVAAWAAEWAAAFQLGLRREDVWNKFCGY